MMSHFTALLVTAAAFVTPVEAQTKPATTQPAATRPAEGGRNAYHNGEHRFRLKYPSAWEWRENVPGAVAFFAGPLHEDGTRPIVQVTVMPLPKDAPKPAADEMM